MSQENKGLLRRGIEEIWNQGNFAVIEEYVSSDFVVHGSTSTGEIHGPDGVKQYFSALRAAFPDIHFKIEDQIAEGDRVVTRWVAQGTHTGEFQGIPPTGNRICVSGIDIDRIANGKTVECWTNIDELGLLQQLGMIPKPEPVGSS
jgi:steroid delta-isomerase-like uncharacterized protein